MPEGKSPKRWMAVVALVALVCGVLAVILASGGDQADEDDVATIDRTTPTTTYDSTSTSAPTTAPPVAERVDPAGHPTTTRPAPTTSTTNPPPPPPPTTTTPPTLPPTIPPTSAPVTLPPSTAPSPTTPPAPRAPATAWTLGAYHGLGVWLDTWDWSPTFTNGNAAFRTADVDAIAARGVETIYIQTGRYDRPDAVLDEGMLRDIIDRAHGHGIAVVGWYLPTMVNVDDDMRHLIAAAELPLDGLAVDIESLLVTDPATRTARLIDLSARLDALYPGQVLGAITLPPVATEILNPAYWPGHPWRQLAEHYDVFMPMAYWGNRTPASGWYDGYRYTAENIDLIRSLTGDPGMPIHPIGGVGSDITASQIDGMVRASAERGAIGGSIYDWYTTAPDHWRALAGFAGW